MNPDYWYPEDSEESFHPPPSSSRPRMRREAELRSLRGTVKVGGISRWAMVGVALLGVVTKVLFLGGYAGHVELLDPRFGGVDGLGVLGARPARYEQLKLHALFHDPHVSTGTSIATPTHTVSSALLEGFGGNENHLPGVNVDGVDVGDARRQRRGREHAVMKSNPYGVLARTAGRSNVGGVLARVASEDHTHELASRTIGGLTEGERVSVDGSLSVFKNDVANMGGSLAAERGSRYGGVLFDKSLGGEDRSWDMSHSVQTAALPHSTDKAALLNAQGPLLALQAGTDKSVAQGVLAALPMTNPDGVLAVYGKTGEYVDKQRFKEESRRLHVLKEFEQEADRLYKAQTAHLAALEREQAAQAKLSAEEKEVVANKAKLSRLEAAAQGSKKLLTGKHSASQTHKRAEAVSAEFIKMKEHNAKAQAKHAHLKHTQAKQQRGKQLQKASLPRHMQHLADAEEISPEREAAGRVFAEDGGKLGDAAAERNYNDIGWVKQQWDVGSWVLFVVFGPLFTCVMFALVWHCSGLVAALVMVGILVCLDLSAYYYSWFLV